MKARKVVVMKEMKGRARGDAAISSNPHKGAGCGPLLRKGRLFGVSR
ncbi:MAG: hypothetical protein IKS61_01955 [Aeriscardovia sp.]|nr:hypothetical protein [Aeriscardovia sp.]